MISGDTLCGFSLFKSVHGLICRNVLGREDEDVINVPVFCKISSTSLSSSKTQ